MDFNTLDKRMRAFELSMDRTIPENTFLVARLDGHGFTRLTKQVWDLDKPFDIRFNNAMRHTVRHLMDCGFRIIYGYTQSDEISLLFHPLDTTFGHRERKLLSILSAEASVSFSSEAKHPGVFDCRLIPLPDSETVIDYFRWRMEDCLRNSLNSHCYWLMRKKGLSPSAAQDRILGISNNDKLNILETHNIIFEQLPIWQKYGVGGYYKNILREGHNPITGKSERYERRTLFLDESLPYGDKYSLLLADIIQTS